MLQLNKENYHSLKANQVYMSRSQYLDFLNCEAYALAKIQGKWIEETSDAFLVGSYVHSWNEGARREFISEHPEMFTKAGGLKAQFQTADLMIETLAADPLVTYMLEGEKEVTFTAEFAGAIWKVRSDVYNQERRRMVELKTTKSILEKSWSQEHGSRVSFIEMYRYLLQAALYCEIERSANGREPGDWLEYYMVAVSKEKVPDKAVIDLRDPERYAEELAQIEFNMPRVLKVKAGEVDPARCEACDYCRSTKVLTGAIHYTAI